MAVERCMVGLIGLLRNGEWLTRERMRLVAGAVLLASLAGVAYLLATASGLNDYQNRPLGTDFSNVYAAGALVLDGRPEAPFYPAQHHAREQAIFGADTPSLWLALSTLLPVRRRPTRAAAVSRRPRALAGRHLRSLSRIDLDDRIHVMARLVPAIHVFLCSNTQRRCPEQARA